jgi:hypothetical protein
VSPDLTRNDPTKLGPSGGPITRDNTGAEVYCVIFALVESPHERDVLWAGPTTASSTSRAIAAGRGRPVTPPDLPEWALVSVLEPSPHDAATCYVAATRYKLDDTRPYLYKTSDYGRTWKRIAGNLPEGEITRVVREDPSRRGLLYCGTETGVWVSLDDGGAWQRLRGNLPVAPIHDLIVKDTDLVVATHGTVVLDPRRPLTAPPDGRRRRLRRRAPVRAAPGGAVACVPRPRHEVRAEPRGRVSARGLDGLRLSPDRVPDR